MDYHSIKWITDNKATRLTKEVALECEIRSAKTLSNTGGCSHEWEIVLKGSADFEHHLLEDAAILLKKMCDKKCGEHSI